MNKVASIKTATLLKNGSFRVGERTFAPFEFYKLKRLMSKTFWLIVKEDE
jgi:hypothetical protein